MQNTAKYVKDKMIVLDEIALEYVLQHLADRGLPILNTKIWNNWSKHHKMSRRLCEMKHRILDYKLYSTPSTQKKE